MFSEWRGGVGEGERWLREPEGGSDPHQAPWFDGREWKWGSRRDASESAPNRPAAGTSAAWGLHAHLEGESPDAGAFLGTDPSGRPLEDLFPSGASLARSPQSARKTLVNAGRLHVIYRQARPLPLLLIPGYQRWRTQGFSSERARQRTGHLRCRERGRRRHACRSQTWVARKVPCRIAPEAAV